MKGASMDQTYAEAIRAARERYEAAMDEVAADVVFIYLTFGKPRATVCKEIAGAEGWNALDHAARALEKRAGQTPDDLRVTTARRTQRTVESHAKAVLADPDARARVLDELEPDVLADVIRTAERVARVDEVDDDDDEVKVDLPVIWADVGGSMRLIDGNSTKLKRLVGEVVEIPGFAQAELDEWTTKTVATLHEVQATLGGRLEAHGGGDNVVVALRGGTS